MSAHEPSDAALRDARQRQTDLAASLQRLAGVRPHETRFEGELCLVSDASGQGAVNALVEERFGPAAKPANAPVPAALGQHPLVAAIGGIHGDQTLYLHEVASGLTLYVAYWPWGSGAQFTIKLGVHVPKAPGVEAR